MTIFAISYCFREDAGAAARRESLVREIGRCARIWDETTSFALVETAEPLAALEARLYLDSGLNAIKDRLVVIELVDARATARGVMADREGLRALLPGVAIA